MEYSHLNKDALYEWAKGLIQIKGSAIQKELLEHVLANDHACFADFVEDAIAAKAGAGNAYHHSNNNNPLSLADKNGKPVIALTPGHMYLMPAKDIVTLFDHWKDIPYVEAARPSLWGATTLSEIRAKRIHPVWLAVHRSCSEEKACSELSSALKQDYTKTDTMVRRVLRWLSGPGALRGAPELYANCSLAKAWWCGYLAKECSQKLDCVNVTEAAEALKEIWLDLAHDLSGRLTVVAEINIVSAIVLWVHDSKIKRKDAKEIVKKLGEITSWCALGIDSPQSIHVTIQELHQ